MVTLVFPGVASPLNVFILGVPHLNPAVSVLMRWPTASSVQGGPVGYCGDSPGPHPLPWEGHFLIFEVCVNSSCRGLSLPTGWLLEGTVPSLLAASFQISSIAFLNWASSRSLRAICNCGGAPIKVAVTRGRLGHHLPTWNWCFDAKGMLPPHSHIFSCLGASRRTDMELYRFIVPCNGCT